MQSVYIETTIPSYLTSRPSKQNRIASDQQATHRWWENEKWRYRLFTSAFTIDECSRGDSNAAERRLEILSGIPELEIPLDLHLLEADIIRLFQIPKKSLHRRRPFGARNHASDGLHSHMELHALGKCRPSERT